MNSACFEEEPTKARIRRKLAFKQVALGLNRLIETGIAQHMKQLADSLDHLQQCVGLEEKEKAQSTTKKVLTLLAQDLCQIEDMKQNVRDEELNRFELAAENTRLNLRDAIIDAKKMISSTRTNGTHTIPEHTDTLEQKEKAIHELQIQQIQLLKTEIDNETLAETAQNIENISKDMNDLKEIMVLLNQNVAEQGEALEAIEHNVETAKENVNRGQILLAQARNLKTAALPLLGMTVGLVAGGPVGAVAGTQVGVLTSMVGGALGYAGGKIAHQINRFKIF